MGIGGFRIRLILALLFSAVLLLSTASSALAIPAISSLTSPTHPDDTAWYPNHDPVLEWSYDNPTLLGSYDTPDWSIDTAVSGNYAYVADRDSLQVIDISDQSAPVPAGSYDTPYSWGVAVAGNYAYVADAVSGLLVINISDPSAPALAGSYDTPGTASGIAVAGNYAYVADGASGLQVIDISDPSAPSLAGSYDTPDSANSVALAGSYAYIADGDAGMQVIDITNPFAPAFVGVYDTPDFAKDVAVSGNYAYLVCRRNNSSNDSSGLHVIDVSDPANPSLISNYSHEEDPVAVAVDGNRVYLSGNSWHCQLSPIGYCDGNYYAIGHLTVLDISDLANPVKAGVIQIGQWLYSAIGGISSRDGNVYLAGGVNGLQIIQDYYAEFSYSLDQSPDTVPDTIPEGAAKTTSYQGIPDGEYWFHVAIVENGSVGEVSHRRIGIDSGCSVMPDLRIENPDPYWSSFSDYQNSVLAIDFSLRNAGSFAAVGASIAGSSESQGATSCFTSDCSPSLELKGSYDTFGYAYGVAVSGDHAYVSDWTMGLQIFDVSDPASASLVGTVETPIGDYEIEVDGDRVYTGSKIIDISDPASASILGSFATLGGASDVAISGTHAFVSEPSVGLEIVDVSDPANAAQEQYYETPGDAKSLTISGDRLYLADGPQGLRVYELQDTGNAAAANYIDRYDTPGNLYEVAVSGNYAYLVDHGFGLMVLDVSDPHNMTLVGSYETPGPEDIAISGHYAYTVAHIWHPTETYRLLIFDISEPANPVLVNSYEFPGAANDIAVQNDTIYIAEGYTGLQILAGAPPPIFPLSFGDLLPGEAQVFTIKFTVPEGVGYFTTSFTGSAQDSCGNTYTYGE